MTIKHIEIFNSAAQEDGFLSWLERTNTALQDRSIHSACLLKVFKRINFPGYTAVSVITLNERPKGKAALGPDGQEQEIANLFKPVLHRRGPCSIGDVTERMIIVNPYRIPIEEAPANAAMWLETATMMEGKKGFISATLYETTTPGRGEYHFISMAEWACEEDFLSIFDGADYHSIVAPFQEKFQICFARFAYTSAEIHSPSPT